MPNPDPKKRREYAAKWIRQRRAEWFAQNGPCVKCGSSENLEIDHIDPKQKVSHAIWSWSKPRREAEAAKCQPLCRKCHKDKTARSIGRSREHGTPARYFILKCRCEECRAAFRAYRLRRVSYAGLPIDGEAAA